MLTRRIVLLIAVLIATEACSLNAKPVGSKDPTVEIARENGTTIRALADAMKAQAEAMSRLAIAALAAQTPTPTPEVNR